MFFIYKTVSSDTVLEDNKLDLSILNYYGGEGWEFVNIFGEEALFKKEWNYLEDQKE